LPTTDWVKQTEDSIAHIAVIGEGFHRIQEVSIGLVHSTRGGFSWRIEGFDLLPSTRPFLVTSEVLVNLIFAGNVGLNLDEVIESIVSGEDAPVRFMIGSLKWFGVVYIADVSRPHRGFLTAFASDKNAEIKISDQIFLSMDDSPFGRIEVLR
jgi:hypothetical protein